MQHIVNPHDILKYPRIKATNLHSILIRQIKTRLSGMDFHFQCSFWGGGGGGGKHS